MVCKKCGLENENIAKFCAYCGNHFELHSEINKNLEISNNIQNEFMDDVESSIESVIEGKNSVETLKVENLDVNQAPIKNNKKKLLLIIISSVILTITILISFLLYNYYKEKKHIKVLDTAVSDLIEKFDNVTLTAEFSMETTSKKLLTFSSYLKIQNSLNQKHNLHLHVEKSSILDEINLYAITDKRNITLFLESKMIDVLNDINQENSFWLYHIIPITESNEKQFALKNIITKENFKFISEEKNLKHYTLIMDDMLINKLKEQFKSINNNIKDIIDSMNNLDDKIVIHFYIDDKNEIKNIKLDLNGYLKNSELKNLTIDLNIKNLNKTIVEIPVEAKSTTVDIKTYQFENQNNN